MYYRCDGQPAQAFGAPGGYGGGYFMPQPVPVCAPSCFGGGDSCCWAIIIIVFILIFCFCCCGGRSFDGGCGCGC